METDFKIKTGEFEGPLEALLEMIEKRKLHINDVSLSEVADTFIEHVQKHTEFADGFPLGDSADFILIASTLLLIKSKSLLPNLELSEEEKVNIEDLEKRLELYKKFKETSNLIKNIFGQNPLYFANENRERPVIFHAGPEINIENIFSSIQDVLRNVPKTEILPKVNVSKVISLEEMIESLSKRVEQSIKMSFREFAHKDKADKIHVIVSFLAMLELVKQGLVRAHQTDHFSDISLESESLSVPRY